MLCYCIDAPQKNKINPLYVLENKNFTDNSYKCRCEHINEYFPKSNVLSCLLLLWLDVGDVSLFAVRSAEAEGSSHNRSKFSTWTHLPDDTPPALSDTGSAVNFSDQTDPESWPQENFSQCFMFLKRNWREISDILGVLGQKFPTYYVAFPNHRNLGTHYSHSRMPYCIFLTNATDPISAETWAQVKH